jgi:hypothetical protein
MHPIPAGSPSRAPAAHNKERLNMNSLRLGRAGAGPGAILAAVTVGWVLWILILPVHPISKHVSNLGLTVMPLGAALQCVRRGAGLTGRLRRGWLLMGASCLSWGSGMVVWTWYETLGGRDVPFPSVADFGYLAAVPLAVAALLAFPTTPQRLTARALAVVDGLLIGAALLVVSWVAALGPIVQAGASGTHAELIAVAYPLGDVVMATIVLFALGRSRRWNPLGSTTLIYLCGGLLATAIADSGFSYLALQGSYVSGSRIDAGWFVGYLMVFLAATRAPHRSDATMETPLCPRSARLVPYTPVALAVVVAAAHLAISGSDSFVIWTAPVITMLLLLRQVLTSFDNLDLQRSLETWVPSPAPTSASGPRTPATTAPPTPLRIRSVSAPSDRSRLTGSQATGSGSADR